MGRFKPVLAVFVLLLFSFLLFTGCDLLPGALDTETETETDATLENELLPALDLKPGVLSIKNPTSSIITVYVGDHDFSSPTVLAQVTVPANTDLLEWEAPLGTPVNIWHKSASGESASTLYGAGAPALFTLDASTGYLLEFKSYDTFISAKIMDHKQRYPGDWAYQISEQRSFGSVQKYYNGDLSAVKVNIINSPEWDLEPDGAYIVHHLLTDTANWIYGALKLRYTGTEPRISVSVNIRVRNAEGKVLFLDSTYLDGVNYRYLTGSQTSSCVDAEDPLAYAKIIENIRDWNIAYSEIDQVDLIFESFDGVSYNKTTAFEVGEPEFADYYYFYPIKNTTGFPIEDEHSVVYFGDSAGREYYWDFTDLRILNLATNSWDLSFNQLPAGETARLSFAPKESQFFTETYAVDDFKLRLNWDEQRSLDFSRQQNDAGLAVERAARLVRERDQREDQLRTQVMQVGE